MPSGLRKLSLSPSLPLRLRHWGSSTSTLPAPKSDRGQGLPPNLHCGMGGRVKPITHTRTGSKTKKQFQLNPLWLRMREQYCIPSACGAMLEGTRGRRERDREKLPSTLAQRTSLGLGGLPRLPCKGGAEPKLPSFSYFPSWTNRWRMWVSAGLGTPVSVILFSFAVVFWRPLPERCRIMTVTEDSAGEPGNHYIPTLDILDVLLFGILFFFKNAHAARPNHIRLSKAKRSTPLV